MGRKLSQVHREVLEYMAQGHKIYADMHGGSWLDGVRIERGLYKRVHGNTLRALRKRNHITRNDTADTPWWRRDYEITNEGRDALDEVLTTAA